MVIWTDFVSVSLSDLYILFPFLLDLFPRYPYLIFPSKPRLPYFCLSKLRPHESICNQDSHAVCGTHLFLQAADGQLHWLSTDYRTRPATPEALHTSTTADCWLAQRRERRSEAQGVSALAPVTLLLCFTISTKSRSLIPY